ncbi:MULTISPECIES: type II toxin-antitoxin system Phd/YefM family antitoxin [Streptomyces]|uniref:type II toxin-antitoxin system Phd/YefM family antitoxin n=1 Tax=Streptomyces TaxID=1883 RepID=UPI00163C2ECA|nr:MULTISPECIES: type II toxin-antitoxin system Phd/YefM family antitoxin [Streptomyces]MBC2875298.1 type II toxin-antitoxin system Phd/YefM family antitoxin [Streptomyces sp. TYQ1024]UBI37121.1 type II toxin-antitoxin system Phd/YefM family antitoxin [Streptomyces mobaraensis]UKW29717.1 type II toxin-antitoxin system Phd/YefM family antitoxin [Streptomyces sp. TYQ1024]
METYPLVEARNQLGQLVGRVRHGHEHIVITEYGKPAAALIPIGELEEYERLRDEADLARAKAVAEDPGSRWIPHDQVEALLAADEAAEGKPAA